MKRNTASARRRRRKANKQRRQRNRNAFFTFDYLVETLVSGARKFWEARRL